MKKRRINYQLTGFTVRHRKRWKAGYHLDPLLFILMDWFIDFAAWKDTKVFVPSANRHVKLKRGECVFTVGDIQNYIKATPRQLRTRLTAMRTNDFLTIKTTNRFSIATILNYSKYQDRRINERQAERQTGDKQRDFYLLKKEQVLTKGRGENIPSETEKKQIAEAANRRIEATTRYLDSVKSVNAVTDVKAPKDLKAKLMAKAKDQDVNFKL